MPRWENQLLETECVAAQTNHWRSTSSLILIHSCLTLNIHNCRLQRVSLSISPVENLWCCSSPRAPHGRVVLTFFFHLAPMITEKITSSVSRHDWIQAHRSDLSLSPHLWISQRRAARIDTGRSNKAGRLRGHHGVALTVTAAITTSSPAPPHTP